LVFLLLFLCRILNQQKSYLHGMPKQIIPLLFLLLKWVGG
jgi:hypothetical protein